MDRQLILWQIVAAYGFAIAGGAIGALLHLGHRPLCVLISVAAGTLLGVTLFAVLPESLENADWWAVVIAFGTGYALFLLISKYVHHVCPACAASHFDADAARHFSEIAIVLMIALAIHSTTDGIALSLGEETKAAAATKWSLFSALCIHKVPEGLALASLLVGAGSRRLAAVATVASIEATTLLGGIMGLFFLTNAPAYWLGLIMAHVAGGFFYLAAHALLGEMMKHGRRLVVTSFASGFLLIALLDAGLRVLPP